MLYYNDISKLDNSSIDLSSIDESDILTHIDTLLNWKKGKNDYYLKKYESNSISNKQFEKLKDSINIIKECDGMNKADYGKYKLAFNELCNTAHISTDGVIISKYKLKYNGNDRNYFMIQYSSNTKEIILPDDYKCYHISRNPNLKYLTPCFKGKSDRGYLYDKPRIYLTINKGLPKQLADYKGSESIYRYVVKKNINKVYMDPLVWGKLYGACYIEDDSMQNLEIEKIENNILD